MKTGKNLSLKDNYKAYFNPMLNKTRVDNLPPLQEKTVFDQSYESKRKQTANQQLRSRSKNFYNLENGTYASGITNDVVNAQNYLEENKSKSKKLFKSPGPSQKDSGGGKVPTVQIVKGKPGSREFIVDSSISVVSSMGGSSKEILIKTGNNIVKSKDNK